MVGVTALHLGAIVYVRDVEPMEGTVGETKTRRVILLRKCSGPDDAVPCVVIKTLRGATKESDEIGIPWKPTGHPQTSLTSPSAAVCSWVINVSVDGFEEYKGKCPAPLTAEIMRLVQKLAAEKANPNAGG